MCVARPLRYKPEAQGVLRDQEGDGYYKPQQSIGATNQVLKKHIWEIKSLFSINMLPVWESYCTCVFCA